MKSALFNQIRGNDPLVERPKNVIQGTVAGYYVNAMYGVGGRPVWRIVIDAKPGDRAPQYPVEAFLDGLKKSDGKISGVSYDGKHLEIQLKNSGQAGRRIRSILDQTVMYLSQNGFVTCCGSCGQQVPAALSSINGYMDFLCDSCYDRLCQGLEANKQNLAAQKGNMLTGIVGALLGALLGGVLWVVIYQLGYIAGIAGLVAAVCALKGYEKFGGKINKAGIVVCMVIVVAVIYFAHNIGIALALQREFANSGIDVPFFTIYKAMPQLMEESNTTGMFMEDLMVGYLLTALASFATIRSMLLSKTGSYKTGRY